jgi:hypothetical protein
MANINTDPIKDLLQDTINKIAKNMATMKDSKGRNRYGSGNTAQSIGSEEPLYKINVKDGLIEVDIYMPKHYDFIDKGVNGLQKKRNSPYSFRKASPPPLAVIRQFMLNRGIVPRGKNGKRLPTTESSLNSLAYIIGVSIKKNGIEGVPYYSKVINDKWVTNFADTIIRLYGNKTLEDLTVNFKDRQPKQL